MINDFHLTDLVIASGTDESNVLDRAEFKWADGFIIGAPGTLTGTITIEVSLDGGSTYHTLQSAGSDVAIGAGDAVTIDMKAWDKLRLASSGNEGATRTFKVKGFERISG